jgi:predicted alpha/beta-hydrolase family hydrolase
VSPLLAIEVGTSQGPALLDWTAPAAATVTFVMALTHGAGGTTSTSDLYAARDAAVQLGGGVALVTQPYRVRGARAPGSAERQDQAWIEIMAWLRQPGPTTPPVAQTPQTHQPQPTHQTPQTHQPQPTHQTPQDPQPHEAQQTHQTRELRESQQPLEPIPLIVGGRSNGARVACRTAAAVGAHGVLALAFPLQPPARRSRGSGTATFPPDRSAELRAGAAGGTPVLVLNGDRDPFGIPPADESISVVVLKDETHALSKRPVAVTGAVTDWLSGVMLVVPRGNRAG